ncbi:MAG TPA: biopolymer transporter ExbD [Thermoanaerobaculia bacterium]|jgi:biopolymer transport protein TolR|nr:biopolymer transporter ExbD [Thermoanaerobaculia bacterium]
MRPQRHNLIEPEISLKPLADVCIVLAIILLVVAPMLRTGAEAALQKTAKKAQVPASMLALDEPQLAISMEADGTLYVDGRKVEQRKLQSVLGEIWSLTPNRPVLVKGDRKLRYEQVRWLLQSVSAAGFRRAGLASEKR